MVNKSFKSIVSGLGKRLPDLEKIYKNIHSHPELSSHETETARLTTWKLMEYRYEVSMGVEKQGYRAPP